MLPLCSVMESRLPPSSPPFEDPAVSVAEDLPELYRAILDRVADLERSGARREAGRIRSTATQVYSSAWDESARRLLVSLVARAERHLAAPQPVRGWTLRRRSVPAR